jgi:hypothetical protein
MKEIVYSLQLEIYDIHQGSAVDCMLSLYETERVL